LNSRAAIELVPDERIQRIRDAIAADPTAPIRLGLIAPSGYGKSAALAELTAIYESAGVPVTIVDDAHLLDSARLSQIRELVGHNPARVIVAARPWPTPAGLRELAAVLELTTLGPLDRAQIAARLARPGLEELVLAQTSGVPALVDRVVRALDGTDPDGPPEMPASAIAELGAELEALPADLITFLLALDAGAGLHVDLLCDLLGQDRDGVSELAAAARASGLTDHGRLIPMVRQALRTRIPVDRRTAVRQRLTGAQLARGVPWAESVALAGDLDTALRAADQVLATPNAADHAEAARVAAAALAHRGQLARGTELFRWSGSTLCAAFAVIGQIGTGQPSSLPVESTSDAPPTLLSGAASLMAQGVAESVTGSPADALSSLVRASSLLEVADTAVLLPDSPAALAALVAVQSGELAVAESVLHRAVRSGMGAVPFTVRHRMLRAWVALCRGDLSAAQERLRGAIAARVPGSALPPRDWLFAVALEVGLARRNSDLTTLRRLWSRAGDVVTRNPVDLYTLLPLGEFAVAAARLGDADRLAAHLRAAWDLLERHGNPPLWGTWLHWNCLHAAIIAEQPADEHLSALAAGGSRFSDVLATAAATWLDVLVGRVDATSVEEAAKRLHAAGLRWDAARLAGQAAIRTADRKAMVNLMECARVLQGDATTTDPIAETPAAGKLSEREQQVARLVLDGLTYREVGDRLFISAKTVEHHVARMRQRLGATNRRELLAQLRLLLGR
jgi:DNA-binding NarL/FixJ family response regulator